MAKTIRDLFYETGPEDRMIHKWDHYFDIYEKYFAHYREKPLNFLEIGIMHGGSLNLWKNYFGEQLRLYAMDINPECKAFEEQNIQIHIGSQEDPVFLQGLAETLPDLDIILDDGGHTMKQQLLTFETLFPKLKEGGIYLVEDTHTSYWELYGGGLRRKSSFIEYCKKLVDSLYIHHLHDPGKVLSNEHIKQIHSITFYDSVVVFEKKKHIEPFHTRLGKVQVNPYEIQESKWGATWRKWIGTSVRSFARNDRYRK
ncbi:MAG: class I SAM-dependent methyltransferase [Bacteroidota bacterium]